MWGDCEGDILPQIEIWNGLDDDCDGIVDEGSVCVHGKTRPCYNGPTGTEGMGPCRAGVETCVNGEWDGLCQGEVTPKPELCNGFDDDCNGAPDDSIADVGTACTPMLPGGCGAGQGFYICTADGLVCEPNIKPTTEVCNGLDDDCDGEVDEGPFCCIDNKKNGDETDINCGGSCAQKCQAGQTCLINADCASGTCTNGICQP